MILPGAQRRVELDVIISYPKSASGRIVLLKTTTNRVLLNLAEVGIFLLCLVNFGDISWLQEQKKL